MSVSIMDSDSMKASYTSIFLVLAIDLGIRQDLNKPWTEVKRREEGTRKGHEGASLQNLAFAVHIMS